MAVRLTRILLTILVAMALSACVAAPGCGEKAAWPEGKAVVQIKGRTFTLDLAADDATRTKGLAMRESIPEDGGMLFSFPTSQLRKFVMRDCLVDIDIIFLDASGRVLATHHMPAEPPRGEGEGEVGDFFNRAYHDRLPQYSSKFGSKYAIELKGGTLETLNVQPGELIELDTERLARVTK